MLVSLGELSIFDVYIMNKTVLKTSFWTAFSDSLIITFEASHSTFNNARS